MSLLIKLALGALCIYALIGLAAYIGQRRLMYFPDRTHTRPAQVGLMGVEERVLTAPDGARVIAWYGKARPGEPTILYFHGNAGSLAARAPRIERFMGEGWGVYMMTYRGYGGGTGSPTEAANVADARLAYGALVLEGVKPASIILYGESLGSGIAVRIAAERPVAGIVLDAPYTSAVDIAGILASTRLRSHVITYLTQHYPGIEDIIPRAELYLRTFPIDEALLGAKGNDADAIGRGIARFRL
jgi:pimeloyl-ACP methyl ester carboxylesterase